jgi:hypothetical protein
MGTSRSGLSLFAALLVLVTACNAQGDEDCDKVQGRYRAIYTAIGGSCGAFSAYHYPLESSGASSYTRIENFLGTTVSTDVTLRGCQVSLTQQATDKAGASAILDGEMQVESADELDGEMSRREIDATGKTTCQSTYATHLVRLGSSADMTLAMMEAANVPNAHPLTDACGGEAVCPGTLPINGSPCTPTSASCCNYDGTGGAFCLDGAWVLLAEQKCGCPVETSP